MFKFLKEKLKSAISRISESVEKEGKVEEKIIEKSIEEPQKQEKSFFVKLKEKFTGKEEIELKEETKPHIEIKKEEVQPIKIEHKSIKEETRHPPKKQEEKIKPIVEESQKIIEQKEESNASELGDERASEVNASSRSREQVELSHVMRTRSQLTEKKGFFATIKEKIITTKINEEQFEKLFWELELALMENNVAVEVIDKIKKDLKNELVDKPIKRTRVEDTISLSLKNSIEGLFQKNNIDLIRQIKDKKEKPYIIAFFGINGSGKTTSIAKLANMLKDKKISSVLAASDTFRAASMEQLQQHADNLGIKMIKHDYGSDPAAVAFDAIKHAKAKNIDVVLIDTAGRMHSNQNLIDEMKKIIRVAKPDLKIFVGESITGNDCVEQAKTFNESVGIDGIILAKADVDEKGGAAVSVSYVTKKPILFLGTGQKYSDLELFDSGIIMKNLGFT